VVGIVADIRHFGPAQEAQPELYLPHAQVPAGFASIVVRTAGQPMALAETLRREVTALDPDVPLYQVRTLDQLQAENLARSRFYALLLALFAATALALAAAGVYGVMAFTVTRRTREIGVRLALGALPASVVRLVLGEGARLAAAGAALGVLLALALVRVLAGLLHGVRPLDAPSYVAAAAVLFAVALVAGYLPARRAARLDPALTLRDE
jgi:putative ABC transport system permease protein